MAKQLHEQQVRIPLDANLHAGELGLPPDAKGIVLFAHGSGSSRLSPRNTFVARVLQQGGIATLLFDLLTVEEDRIYETRFDISLLTQRLLAATEWVRRQSPLETLPIGYFGASTGAAAALKAAAALGREIKAVVSRGGRPDLAGDDLARVQAPTLLIVGGDDTIVIELNAAAMEQLQCIKHLEIVPGATHLFEEPGALEQVAQHAGRWFERFLGQAKGPAGDRTQKKPASNEAV